MITGRARYVDDIVVAGNLWIAIVRSAEAHRIVSIDKSSAERRDDVVAVFTSEDLAGDFAAPMVMVWSPPGAEIKTPALWPLARGEVKHVGDPVAVVVGTDRYSVIDAAEEVVVEYAPQPVVLDPEKALEDGSPLVWEQFGTNRVVRYVAVDDCGPEINPMPIDGQIHGGITHAIGQALYEQVMYDEDGQLVTGTFVDYAMPTAAELPNFETDRTETPSPVNSLGVKGIGEAGTIAATPAVAAAVVDAVAPLGVKWIDMPLTPRRVWEAIAHAQNGGEPT